MLYINPRILYFGLASQGSVGMELMSLFCIGSMLCHCPPEVDDYTEMLLMQLTAFLKNKTGNALVYLSW